MASQYSFLKYCRGNMRMTKREKEAKNSNTVSFNLFITLTNIFQVNFTFFNQISSCKLGSPDILIWGSDKKNPFWEINLTSLSHKQLFETKRSLKLKKKKGSSFSVTVGANAAKIVCKDPCCLSARCFLGSKVDVTDNVNFPHLFPCKVSQIRFNTFH